MASRDQSINVEKTVLEVMLMEVNEIKGNDRHFRPRFINDDSKGRSDVALCNEVV